ncbi:MAG: alpha/beta hydrolase [Thermoflexales bacterium]|nr:alpha/beta hydrolase [Thermoflexales bacterium]
MSRLKKFLLIGLGSLTFIIVGLPYLLPLTGTAPVDPVTLADADGAFVQAGDTRVYYEKAGAGDVPIVLVHGFGASSFSWRNNLRPIAEAGYTVYAPDMRGFGLSDKSWDGTMAHAAQADRLAAFMDAVGIDRAVLAGNSMGGNIIAHFALKYPDRVRGLIFVDAAIFTGAPNAAVVSTILEFPPIRRWGQHAVRFLLADDTRNADTIKSAWYDPAKLSDDVLIGYRRALRTPDWDLGLLAMSRDSGQNDISGRLAEITAPTLIIWGEHDTWINPANGPRLQQAIADSKLIVIPQAGHVPHEEQPEEFNQLVIEFVGGLK